jgi:hypothetical protein
MVVLTVPIETSSFLMSPSYPRRTVRRRTSVVAVAAILQPTPQRCQGRAANTILDGVRELVRRLNTAGVGDDTGCMACSWSAPKH